MLQESDFIWVVEKTWKFMDMLSEWLRKQQPDFQMKSKTKETVSF